jgi:hypothetical protein
MFAMLKHTSLLIANKVQIMTYEFYRIPHRCDERQILDEKYLIQHFRQKVIENVESVC